MRTLVPRHSSCFAPPELWAPSTFTHRLSLSAASGGRAQPQPSQLAGQRRSLLRAARSALWPSPAGDPEASSYRPLSREEGTAKERAGPAPQSPQPGTSRSQVRVRPGAGVNARLPPARTPHLRASGSYGPGLRFPAAATPGTAPLGRAARAPRAGPGRGRVRARGAPGAGGAERDRRPEARARRRRGRDGAARGGHPAASPDLL